MLLVPTQKKEAKWQRRKNSFFFFGEEKKEIYSDNEVWTASGIIDQNVTVLSNFLCCILRLRLEFHSLFIALYFYVCWTDYKRKHFFYYFKEEAKKKEKKFFFFETAQRVMCVCCKEIIHKKLSFLFWLSGRA